jgi:hypothetical protein
MKKLPILLAAMLLAGMGQLGWLTPAYGGPPSPPCTRPTAPMPLEGPERSPDRQRFEPVTPEQEIQQDQDRVKRLKEVPAPPGRKTPSQKPGVPKGAGE